MATQEDWSAELTRAIAKRIRDWRRANGWSAQKLSERCADLGMEFPRSTLADLENGRRAHVSVAELLILARALDVPPVYLVFPAEPDGQVKVSPTELVASVDAAQWWAGGFRDQAQQREVIRAVIAEQVDPLQKLLGQQGELLEQQKQTILRQNEAIQRATRFVNRSTAWMTRAAEIFEQA